MSSTGALMPATYPTTVFSSSEGRQGSSTTSNIDCGGPFEGATDAEAADGAAEAAPVLGMRLVARQAVLAAAATAKAKKNG